MLMLRWDWRLELPEPLPPRALTHSPRHTPRALGQRRPRPVIRSWLGGRTTDPSTFPLSGHRLDNHLDM